MSIFITFLTIVSWVVGPFCTLSILIALAHPFKPGERLDARFLLFALACDAWLVARYLA